LLGTRMRAANVYTYIQGEGEIESTRTPLFTDSKLRSKVRMNDKVVGLTELGKTQRNVGLLCAVLPVISYSL
jgi:hypothetical protein